MKTAFLQGVFNYLIIRILLSILRTKCCVVTAPEKETVEGLPGYRHDGMSYP